MQQASGGHVKHLNVYLCYGEAHAIGHRSEEMLLLEQSFCTLLNTAINCRQIILSECYHIFVIYLNDIYCLAN